MANPVISNFFAPEGTTYYKPDGTTVRPEEELHIHADGTIMTEHSEIGNTTMSDTSVVVTSTKPRENPEISMGGMTPLEQDELLNNAKSARTQKQVQRTLNRLSSTRVQKYPAYRQRLQNKLVKLQNQVATQKEKRVQINQARRGQIEPNVLQRQMRDGNISTPIRQPIDNRGITPNPNENTGIRMNTDGTKIGRNSPMNFGNDVGIDSWDQANPLTTGDNNNNNTTPGGPGNGNNSGGNNSGGGGGY